MATPRTLSSLGSLAALAGVVALPETSAQIISSPILNVPLNDSGYTHFNLDGNETNEFSVYVNDGDAFSTLNASPGTLFYRDSGSATAAALDVGDTVDASGVFNSSSDFSLFLNQGVNHLGIAFEREGATHYGWLAFDFPTDQYGDGVALYGAWQQTAGAGLTISAVPEPAETAMAGGLFVGVAALFHRRRRKRTIHNADA